MIFWPLSGAALLSITILTVARYEKWLEVLGQSFYVELIAMAALCFVIVISSKARANYVCLKETVEKLSSSQRQLQHSNQEIRRLNNSLENQVKERTIELEKALDQLQHKTHHHQLTGLPNRLLLKARLEHSVSLAKRQKTSGAVLHVNITNFKDINDSFGYHVGDQFLCAIASRLRNLCREVDTLAHIGGDEFILVMNSVRENRDAYNKAEAIIKALGNPFEIRGYNISLSASVGVAIFPSDGCDVDSLLSNAEAAMHKGNTQEGNRICFYSAEMTMQAQKRITIESQLRKAIHNDELLLHYQPQLDIETGEVVSMEALIRWYDCTNKRLVPPCDFIPVSEECGLIHPIGEWVLEAACKQVVKWNHSGIHPNLQRMAVNISGKQLQKGDLPQIVKTVLQKTKCPPEMLELEVTESCVMTNLEKTVEAMNELRKLGVSLAIDDFGTGHSSLSYLKTLPVDRIKIDRSFVTDIQKGGREEALVKAIIAMSKALNLAVIAEGVETEEQYRLLDDLGCQEAQGYLISPPLAHVKAEEFLAYHFSLQAKVVGA